MSYLWSLSLEGYTTPKKKKKNNKLLSFHWFTVPKWSSNNESEHQKLPFQVKDCHLLNVRSSLYRALEDWELLLMPGQVSVLLFSPNVFLSSGDWPPLMRINAGPNWMLGLSRCHYATSFPTTCYWLHLLSYMQTTGANAGMLKQWIKKRYDLWPKWSSRRHRNCGQIRFNLPKW